MARGVDRLDPPARAGHPLAVAQGHIGNKVPIAPLLDPGLAALASGVWAVPISHRTGHRLQLCCRGRVVAMGVGDKDVGHPLARETGEQRLDVLGEIGAGVDDRDLAATDNIGSGAAEGEGAGVARDDAANPRRHRLEPAVFERELAAERNVDSHDKKTTRDRLPAPRVWPQGLGPRRNASEIPCRTTNAGRKSQRDRANRR